MIEPLGAHQGVRSPPLGLGMLVASHPEVKKAWHLGHAPPLTTSDWSCMFEDFWQHHTLHSMAYQTTGHNSV